MFDLDALKTAVSLNGKVARVVIARFDGSSPREVGASMLVWEGGESGTIGGGALEWLAINRARAMLSQDGARLDREALGPNLGQCCGGAVTLLTEVYDAAIVDRITGPVHARPVDTSPMPLGVQRLLARARGQGAVVPSQWIKGWMVESLTQRQSELWIWGAGHVGRSIIGVLSPLPEFSLSWIDTAESRFPAEISPSVRRLAAENPEVLAGLAPPDALHVIVTYSHALDLELCHRLLRQHSRFIGLIGSATKWARFRSRLSGLGHSPQDIAKITCPVGDTGLGKHPQAIALGVAVQLIKLQQQSETEIADDIRENRAVAFGGSD